MQVFNLYAHLSNTPVFSNLHVLNLRHSVGNCICKAQLMKLSDDLIKKLAKKHEPSTMVHATFRGNDITFKTDADGNAIQLFFGKRREDGTIKGERYARTLKHDKDGRLFKDHWELKGKAS